MKLSFLNKISFTVLTNFTRQFAAMVEARISLLKIINILIAQSENEKLKQILVMIQKDIEAGSNLTEALAKFPDHFSVFYINMIRVGELTGRLDHMLNRIAAYMEKMSFLRRRLVQSMMYPALVISVAFGAVGFLLAYVVPSFAEMFRDFDAELPAITVSLMNLSAIITNQLWLIILAIAALIFLLAAYFKTEKGQWFKDTLKLKAPISGTIIRKNYISRFARTLGILLESGIPMLEALNVTADSIPNKVVHKEIMQMRYFAERGESLTAHIKKSGIFPPMVTQMMTVGEESAQLDRMLSRVADFYDDEIEATLNTLSSVLEPLIIIILGIILGAILIALYLPLFNLVNIVPG